MGSHLAMYGMLSTSSWWNLDTLLGTCKKMPDLEEEKHGMCRQIRIPHKPRMPLQYRHSVWYLRRISVHTQKGNCLSDMYSVLDSLRFMCHPYMGRSELCLHTSFSWRKTALKWMRAQFFPLLLATRLLSNIRERRNGQRTRIPPRLLLTLSTPLRRPGELRILILLRC